MESINLIELFKQDVVKVELSFMQWALIIGGIQVLNEEKACPVMMEIVDKIYGQICPEKS